MGDIDVNVLRTLDYNQPPPSQPSLFVDTADTKSLSQRKMQDAALFEKATSKQLAGSQMFTSSNGNSNEKGCNSSSLMEMRRSVPDENTESVKNNVPSSSHHMVEFAVSSQSQPPSTSSQSTWSPMSSASSNVNYSDNILIQRQNSNNNSLNFQQFSSFSPDYNPSISSSSNPLSFSQTSVTPHQSQSKGGRPITGHSSGIAGYHQLQQNVHANSTNTPQMVANWNNMPPQSWATPQCQSSLYPPWNTQQRRSVPNMSAMPPTMSVRKPAVPLQTPSLVAPSKFRRSTSFPGQMQQSAMGAKSSYEMPAFDDVSSYQQINTHYDSMKFPTLENQLFDIMKNNCVQGGQLHDDNVKGKMPFVIEDPLTEDNTLDQSLANMSGTPGSSPSSHGIDRIERFSRKVFVGGLPPDIDEEEITTAFRRFGALVVDWPHKAESKSYFPPKGYCFLIFQDELSVQSLIEACLMDDDKLYWCVSSPTMKDKPVQIRPWSLSDSDFVMDGSQPLDPRKTIFVGGVPRPLRAVELAMIMDRLYGGVCYAGIDTDPELKYPKGAGRVAFSNQQSYIAAISARFVQLLHGDIDKRVEVKPYVLDDQMCDECHGARCAGKFAPFFCANVTCLQYYCEYCWAQIHSRPGREYHKPLVKEGADRPRAVPFRWCENKLDVYKW